MSSRPEPPPAPPQIPHVVASPHGERVDEYYWMRDDTRSDPRILAHLAAENEYVERALAHTGDLRARLYAELVARVRPDDESVPVKDGGWWYLTRYRPGSEYPLHLRRRAVDAPDEVLLDEDAQAAGRDYYDVGDLAVSPDDRLMAYTDDTVGRRQYTVRFRELATGADLGDTIDGCDEGIAWADDGTTLLYVEQDPETLLGVRVRAHVVGTDPATDRVVFENPDDSFYLQVRRSRSKAVLFIDLDSTDTTETLFAPAGDPALRFATVHPRDTGHEYAVDHLGQDFVIRTNRDAPNFRVVRVPVTASTDPGAWREVVAHSDATFIEGILPQRDHLALSIREGGLLRIRVVPWNGAPAFDVHSDDPSSAMYIGANPEPDTPTLRYAYTSLTTPASDMEIHLETGDRRLLKRQFAGQDFDPARYVSDYLHVPARDGTPIPVTLMRHVDTPLDGTAPMLQYAYGAYGISSDPVFRGSWLTLADRGVVMSIAHVRGGQELGRRWYEAGRREAKMNTFTDFVDVTRGLVARGVAAPDRVFAHGGSAGGLLMGVIANIAPSDYRGIVARVPFVDVVTTMLDPTIPLTTNEYDEWGNPAEADAYATMLAYSPYDNVTAQAYPAMLVMTGLHDSQVQYWEPMKWVARLRRLGTGDRPILFHTLLDAGHGGASGRYRAYEDIALIDAFILDRLDSA